MYEHFLVPVDGSELSDRAMNSSINLAHKLGARITGFIVEPFVPPPASIGEGYQYRRVVRQHDSVVEAHAGKVLERFEELARAKGAIELACDTAEHAHHLRQWYDRMGYRFIEFVQWDVTNFRSVILSKRLIEK